MRTFIDKFQTRALDMMSTGAAVEPFLHDFCVQFQAELPGSLVGLTVLDRPGRTFEHAVFPSLPTDFGKQLTGKPMDGSQQGSCGVAVLTGQVIDVPNIATDTRFSPAWQEIFLAHGITAVLSVPALDAHGMSQGSMAITYETGKTLSADQRAGIALAASLTAKIMTYSRMRSAQRLFLGELEHRMRNSFAHFGAMAQLTLRNYPAPADFNRELTDRLSALAHAQTIALDNVQTTLEALLTSILAPYSKDFPISLNGPDIDLASEAAHALSLSIHELATNAVKYGGLSRKGGALEICWALTPGADSDQTLFSLTWNETGGPEPTKPSRTGYGTITVNSSIRTAFDGVAQRSYPATGLQCIISAPFTAKLGLVPAPATIQ